MVDCWAQKLGGCSTIQSAEHLFSAALFQGKTITVQGFRWCPEPKPVGLANLTANILCTTHNNLLSPLDSTAKLTLDTLAEAIRLSDARAKMKPRRLWSLAKYWVDGQLLERWFMKTAINLFHVVGSDATWLFNGRPADEPPAEFVEFAYGRRSVAEPLGLFAAAQIGVAVGPAGYFSFTPIFGPSEGFAGALLQFQGFDFLLWVCTEAPPDLGSRGVAKPIYHLRSIKFTIGGSPSHVVNLKWQN